MYLRLLALPVAFSSTVSASLPSIIDQCSSECAQEANCDGWHHDGTSCILESRQGFTLSRVPASVDQACTQQNKQKALYLSYDVEPSLAASPALDVSVEVAWNSTTDMLRYGSNGVYAAHPIANLDGPSGYFGSQAFAEVNQDQLIFSIWDKARKAEDINETYCDLAPNVTWCSRRHAFPLSNNCHRHCNDCGLHPGWHNTTGTQCLLPMNVNEGDSFRFRLLRSANGTTLQDPTGLGFEYLGSEWTLTATKLGKVADPVVVGRMFFEDTFEGISRLTAFHEHVGCTPCDAFYESEVRRGLWVDSPEKRAAKSISFERPVVECQLFDVEISAIGGVPTAQFKTGPGTGPELLHV